MLCFIMISSVILNLMCLDQVRQSQFTVLCLTKVCHCIGLERYLPPLFADHDTQIDKLNKQQKQKQNEMEHWKVSHWIGCSIATPAPFPSVIGQDMF